MSRISLALQLLQLGLHLVDLPFQILFGGVMGGLFRLIGADALLHHLLFLLGPGFLHCLDQLRFPALQFGILLQEPGQLAPLSVNLLAEHQCFHCHLLFSFQLFSHCFPPELVFTVGHFLIVLLAGGDTGFLVGWEGHH